MEMSTAIDEAIVTAVKVDDAQRSDFLPAHFGNLCTIVESAIFTFLSRMSDDYRGGLWNFYELSNDGLYMAPTANTPLHLSWADNFFEGDLSPDAAGIVACLMAFSHLSFQYDDQRLVLAFHALRDFVDTHPEDGLIFAAID